MPVDGTRKKIIQGVVAQIKTATGSEYFNDYSGTQIVTTAKDTLEERQRPLSVRVYDGEESTEQKIDGAMSVLDVITEITIREAPTLLVDAVQDVLADLSLVMGKNTEPGGNCSSLLQEGTEAPEYEFTNRQAVVRMHWRAEYDFVPGQTT